MPDSETTADPLATTAQRRGPARVIELKTGDPGPGLFIMPGLGGRIDRLVELATLIRTPMPICAIEARGADGSVPGDTGVAEMAGHYLDLIRMRQHTGPYFLLGHSFGGLVALDIAHRLIRDREAVACLILIDTNIPRRFWPWPYYLKDLKSRFVDNITEVSRLSLRDLPGHVRYKAGKLRRRFIDPPRWSETIVDAMTGSEIAFESYRPVAYPDRVIFFRSSIGDFPADPDALWRRRVAELVVHVVPGGHLTMLEQPNVRVLADGVSSIIRHASNSVRA